VKILVTDFLYPNRYALWRNEEIGFFVREARADVLVFRVPEFAGVAYDFDWDFCNADESLAGHNLLIFDPRYNDVDAHNQRIDGTAFNGRAAASYLLTTGHDLDLAAYDAVYHILHGCYRRFNAAFTFPQSRQFIHLYPGGGFDYRTEPVIDPQVGCVSTHPLTTDLLRRRGQPHVDCWTATLTRRGERLEPRNVGDPGRPLSVCFSSLGFGAHKGDEIYTAIIDRHAERFPGSPVRYMAVGNCRPHPRVQLHAPLDYRQLHRFYAENVDVYVNTETGLKPNGWPLGLEAAKAGCALLTTDHLAVAGRYGPWGERLGICHDPDDFVTAIERFQVDRAALREAAAAAQAFVGRYASFAAQQETILEFITDRSATASR
jgi:hypothetical protein